MSPLREPSVAANTADYRDMQSAHEAGHVTIGLTLGGRIEAVYAKVQDTLPNGNFRIQFFARSLDLDAEEDVLMAAGGAAGEVLLAGIWDTNNACEDRLDLAARGFYNFDYCVKRAMELLEQNKPLFAAMRDRIRTGMQNLYMSGIPQGTNVGTNVSVVAGSEIESAFNDLGAPRASARGFSLDAARMRTIDEI